MVREKKSINGTVRLGYASSNIEGKLLLLEIEDRDAMLRFIRMLIPANMAYDFFAGREVDVEIEVSGLDLVGKKRENQLIEFEVDNDIRYRDEDKLHKLAQEACPEGWTASTYFGSQSSFFSKDGKKFARTQAYRWVETDKPNEQSEP